MMSLDGFPDLHFRQFPQVRHAWNILVLAAFLGPLWVTARLDGHESESQARARTSIVADDLQNHVRLLADDTLEGREAGARGGYTAGNYLVRLFQEHLEPAGNGQQFFQIFGNRYRNILGVLPGSDPILKHEFILIGAHYDHVGYGSRRNSNGPIGLIHNGADDNASGVAGILELIEAFGESKLEPRRSLLFALWDAEEKGLLGSQHWANHPSVPLDRIKLVVNMDMIGRMRNRTLEVLGTRSMPGLRRAAVEANFPDELTLKFPWKVEESSDHYSFFRRRIPVLMYHTGLHSDYHRPSDDTERLNWDGLQATVRLAFNALHRPSNADSLEPFRVASRYEGETGQREYERPMAAPEPRLGISWKPVDPALPAGLIIQSVSPGSAADRAGLRVDDRLVGLNGHPLLYSSTLQQSVVSAVEIQLTVMRESQDENTMELTVPLDGDPARIGISWRHSTAEPKSVSLVRVIRYSIADQAGLRVGDRIHSLDGATFGDTREFRQMIQHMPLPASIRIERAGRIHELTLPSLPSELFALAPPDSLSNPR